MPAGVAGETRIIVATFEIWLEPTVAAPAEARAAISSWLAGECPDGGIADTSRLVVSELVTNCVRHARIDADAPLLLTASLHQRTLRVELHDPGTEGTVARRHPEPDDRGGFGLNLVEQLSHAWGVERDADGTTVWLELRAEPANTGPRGSPSQA